MRKNCVCGIYQITNLQNGKKYIGQSTDVFRRWNHHRSNLVKGTHANRYLQRAVNKYGLSIFSFELIETVDKNNLDNKEIYWIQKLQTIQPHGCNLDAGGGGSRGRIVPENLRDKLRKPVICLNDLQIYKSVIFAEQSTGIERSMIQQCCLGNCSYARNSMDETTVWAYVCDFDRMADKEQYRKEKIAHAEYIRNQKPGNSKPVVRLNDRALFYTAREADIASGLADGTGVLRVADGTARSAGRSKDGERYVWRYVSDYERMTDNEILKVIALANNRQEV